jgi:hypothetical protein
MQRMGPVVGSKCQATVYSEPLGRRCCLDEGKVRYVAEELAESERCLGAVVALDDLL